MRMAIELGTGAASQALANALNADRRAKRGDVRTAADGGSLRLDISADDSVAMRAALQANLRLIDCVIKSLGGD
ncbi:MAG: hypothetical protein JW834_02460 [Candidatus Diapherotrites archaeon]|nr:hypothetical protein [Candidatus Diapherotrites archaeon]